jgi:hypothetical protein
VAEHGHLAAGAVAIALEDLDGGGLPRAVRAEEADHLAPLHAERQPADCFHVPVALAQLAHLDCRL